MDFEKHYLITGTLEGFIRKLNLETKEQIEKMKQINRNIITKAKMNKISGFLELKTFVLENQEWQFWHEQENELQYVENGFIGNASDSLITRIYETPQFIPEIKLSFTCNKGLFSFEVEDNGTGINQEVESSLFNYMIYSKKQGSELKKAYIGGEGIHMYASKIKITQQKGEIYFKNKGLNQGAIFGYRIPLKRL